MKFFIAGIMQGSNVELVLHKQNYRDELKEVLLKTFSDAEVYDPLERNKDSVSYAPEFGKRVFLTHNKMCGETTDVLVAFVPEASMGTAIEMWEAWKNGALVLTISPLATNWAVRFLSDAVYPDLETFKKALASGEIGRLVASVKPRSIPREFEAIKLSESFPTTGV